MRLLLCYYVTLSTFLSSIWWDHLDIPNCPTAVVKYWVVTKVKQSVTTGTTQGDQGGYLWWKIPVLSLFLIKNKQKYIKKPCWKSQDKKVIKNKSLFVKYQRLNLMNFALDYWNCIGVWLLSWATGSYKTVQLPLNLTVGPWKIAAGRLSNRTYWISLLITYSGYSRYWGCLCSWSFLDFFSSPSVNQYFYGSCDSSVIGWLRR